MKKMKTTVTLAAAALFLAGCAGEPAPDTTTPEVAADDSTQQEPAAKPGEWSFAHVTSCDQLESFVEPWLGGLELSEISEVAKERVHCSWAPPEGEVDPSNPRSVEIELVSMPERPDYSALSQMKGYAELSDAWVDENDGEAFTLTIDIGLAASIGTTIWANGVEATVSGAVGEGLPPIDGPTGIEIVKEMLAK